MHPHPLCEHVQKNASCAVVVNSYPKVRLQQLHTVGKNASGRWPAINNFINMSTHRIPIGNELIIYVSKSLGADEYQKLVSPGMHPDDTYKSVEYYRFVPDVAIVFEPEYRNYPIEEEENIVASPNGNAYASLLRYFVILTEADLINIISAKQAEHSHASCDTQHPFGIGNK